MLVGGLTVYGKLNSPLTSHMPTVYVEHLMTLSRSSIPTVTPQQADVARAARGANH